MGYEQVAQRILEIMGERLVVRKSELIDFIKDDVKNPGNPWKVVDTITKMLVQRGLITPLYTSESTFAITQKGIRELRK